MTPKTPSPPRRGLSITELLAVILILVILGGTATLVVSGSNRNQTLAGEARRIEAALGQARSLAISTNTPHQADFWIESPSFWVDRLSTDGLSVAQSQVVSPTALDERLALEIEVTRSTPPAVPPELQAIRFYPDGSSEDATVRLRSVATDPADTTGWYSIRVYGPTGRSRTFPGEYR